MEVRITPEELLVLSFPGADRSIRMEDLQQGRAVSRRYRNRRIGEFLKELDLAEGRSTRRAEDPAGDAQQRLGRRRGSRPTRIRPHLVSRPAGGARRFRHGQTAPKSLAMGQPAAADHKTTEQDKQLGK